MSATDALYRVIARALAFVLVVGAAVSVAAPVGAASSPGAPQGNVTPSAPATTRMGAAAVSAPTDGVIAVLLQNGTSTPRRIDRINAVATRVDGGRATKARSGHCVPPGGRAGRVALASVKFRTRRSCRRRPGRGDGAEHAGVGAPRAQRALSVGGLVLSAPQTGAVAQTMQATLTNGTTSWTARAPEAAIICFGEAGKPSTFAKARARRAASHPAIPRRSRSR